MKILTVFILMAMLLSGCSNGGNTRGETSIDTDNNSVSSEDFTQSGTDSAINRDTVLTAAADAHNSQTLYLWEEGNVPATTEYTMNNGNYADDPDFRPYVVTFPVPEGTEVKGAVLICAGGAFQYRSDANEGTPVARELSKRGYQSFVVNYRLRPYTQEEGALDLARGSIRPQKCRCLRY